VIDRGLNGATDPVVATSVAVLELLTSRMVGLYFAGAMGGRVHGPVRRLVGDALGGRPGARRDRGSGPRGARPGLGRPWVDTLEGSRHANMKELRARGGHIRVLFAFDPVRVAILLLGGDKRDRWAAWYEQAIPEADGLYDEHLAELRDEGEQS